MESYMTYSIKVKHYNHIFDATTKLYRNALEFFLQVCLENWEQLKELSSQKVRVNCIESLTVQTKRNPAPAYDFSIEFYKFPCYLRRAAIAEALGKASSYFSNLQNWENADPATRGNKPSIPQVGYIYPVLYRENMVVRTGMYTAAIKIYIRNTWDWLEVDLRKSDVDYIYRHCQYYKECVPTLQRRGKEWFLDFSFQTVMKLPEIDITQQRILSVDLGINSACTCSVMDAKGTILAREFLRLPREYDSLAHAISHIKHVQKLGNRKMPKLWAQAKGINKDISVKTAEFIVNTAILYNVDCIVMEHLDLGKKKRGSKKQKLHMWRAKYVQAMVTDKAHRNFIRISRICAWGTSKLAFDGSGLVQRGKSAELPTYSLCRFASGKQYNCDLNASYNIGARYFIRELLKTLPETAEQAATANVPELAHRSTCTLSSLIRLHAELAA